MKIPILHQLEKSIRCKKRKNGFNPSHERYRKIIEPHLEIIKTEEQQIGFLQPKVSSSPLVSILIPVYNQFEYTRRCLNSIARNTANDIDYEIILIDDCSTDGTTDLAYHYPNITIHRNETNQGFLKNMNYATTLAKGKYLHLLNNDTIVAPGWLKCMLDVFERFEKVGAVGSKLVYPSGVLQEAGGYITSDAHFGNFGKNKNFFELKYNYIREVDYISGASMLISRQLWDELGGFDEAYLPAYFEDTDLAMRIRQTGLRVMYQPESTVFHFESISYSDAKAANKATQMEKNKTLFLSRWDVEMKRTHATRQDGFRFYERNMLARKTLLYIDAEVPNDYSCGSRLSLNYCKLLIEMGFNVKFLPMHHSKTEVEDIVRMGQLGIEIIATYNLTSRLIIFNKNYLDCFKSWYKRNHQHISYNLLARPSSYKYLNIIKSRDPNAEYLYHPADIHFLRNERAKPFEKTKEKGLRKIRKHLRMAKKKKLELELLRNAAKVLNASSFEKDYLEEHFGHKNGEVIPCLFFDRIDEFRTIPPDLHDLMFIGGCHSASVDGIKWFIKNIFPQILKRHPNTQLHLIGDSGKNIEPSRNVVIHGRLPEEKVIEFYKSKIVIIPLRYGAGVKGKTLEAMYYGAPIVSTAIGLEGIPEVNDILPSADDADSFATLASSVLNNLEHYQPQVKECQKIMNKHFTTEAAAEIISGCFDK